ncbi:MAG: divalent metal cation transporter [Planctomycetaceae bacterium]
MGSALLNANGAVAAAMFPIPGCDPVQCKILYGVLQSLIAVGLVLRGGFQLFEKLMAICIGLMFFVVAVTTILIHDDWLGVLKGMTVPLIPTDSPEGVSWTIGLIGGVGGTVTVLCYGYWIRESGENSLADLKEMRLDLGLGYLMTALFGMAMVIIGSHVPSTDGGTKLLIGLSNQLGNIPLFGNLGPLLKWLFLIGTWGAVFSSLLGVWQSVPYLFADFWNQSFARQPVDRISQELKSYRYYLFALATIPMSGLFLSFARAQKLYAVLGAFFVPMLAMMLLLLLGSNRHIKEGGQNHLSTNIVLGLALLFFLFLAVVELIQ